MAPSSPRSALKAFTQVLIGLRPTLRRLIPGSLHHMVGEVARAFIRRVEQGDAPTYDDDAFRLATMPLFPPAAFATGPILHANSALAWGGAERQLVNLLKGLPPRVSRPVGLLCLRLGESPEFDFFLPELADTTASPRNAVAMPDACAQLDGLGGTGLRAELADALAWAPKDFLADVLRFAAEFAGQRPRIVHGWQDGVGLAAAFAAVAVGVPRIIIACRNVRPANFSYYRPYMHAAYRMMAAEPRVLLTNNSEAGARDYAAWLGIDATRIKVVRNGIDTTRVHRIEGREVEAFRRRLGVPADAPLVGSLFRLYPEKRPLLWVRAAALIAKSLPEAHFANFGAGAMEAQFVREARRCGIGERVHLMPATHAPSLALSAFDVFMLTSRYEGTPNVVLEASLAGVPVVATDAGGVAETVLEGRTGYVLAEHDGMSDEERAQAIAERVVAVLGNASWRARARHDGPEFVRSRFGMERMIADTLALYGLDEERR